MPRRLSKSQFMMGLQCPKRLWLYNYRRELRPPADPAKQQLFDEGRAVDELARGYYKGGKLVACDHRPLQHALEHTAWLMANGAGLVYEGAFSAAGALVRCDILKNSPGGWDLIEVKSSTSVKDEHLPDAAFQRLVLEAAGVKVGRVWLMHINGDFVKSGAIDPKKFFRREDITKETAALLPEVRAQLPRFLELLDDPRQPEAAIGRQCRSPYECEFCPYCWKGVPEYSIYDVPRLSWENRAVLKAMGVLAFRDVPDNFELNAAQRLYLEVERTGRTAVDKAALRAFLARLKYPLYHIDFETIMPGIPLYYGSRPYQQLPFQVSVHVQASPGAAPRHLEYLGDPAGDPRPGLVAFLMKEIGPAGSLLAYNAAFEGARLKELARDFPSSGAALTGLAGRLADLMKPFQEQAYVLPEFKGRYSLKVLLPAMVPGMTYEGLPIANGGEAQLAYLLMARGKTSPAEAGKARRDLLTYCGQDTLAMVKILARLYAAAG